MPLTPLPDLLSLGLGAGPPQRTPYEQWLQRQRAGLPQPGQPADGPPVPQNGPLGQPQPQPIAPADGIPPPFMMGPPAPLMGPPPPTPQQLALPPAPVANGGILQRFQRGIQGNPSGFDEWARSNDPAVIASRSGQPQPLPDLSFMTNMGPRTASINYVQSRDPDSMEQPGQIRPGSYRMQDGGFSGGSGLPAPVSRPLAGGLPLTSPGMTLGTTDAPATQQEPIGEQPPRPRAGGFGTPGTITVNLPGFENPDTRRPVLMNELGTVYRLGQTMPSEGEQMAQLARQGRNAGALDMPPGFVEGIRQEQDQSGISPFQRFLQELHPMERWVASNHQNVQQFYRDLNNSQEAPSLAAQRRGMLDIERSRAYGMPGVPGSIQNAADAEARLGSQATYQMSPEARADAVIAGRIAQDPYITPEEIHQIRQAFRAGHISGRLSPLAPPLGGSQTGLPSPGGPMGLSMGPTPLAQLPGGSQPQPVQPTPQGPAPLADVPGAITLGPGNIQQGLDAAFRRFLNTSVPVAGNGPRTLPADSAARRTLMLNFMSTQAFRQAMQADPVAAVRFLQDGMRFGPEAWNSFWNHGVRLPGDSDPVTQAQNEVLQAFGGRRVPTYPYIGQVSQPASFAAMVGGIPPVLARMTPQDIEGLIRDYQTRRAGPSPLPPVR